MKTLLFPYLRHHGIGYIDIATVALDSVPRFLDGKEAVDQLELFSKAKDYALKKIDKVIYLVPKRIQSLESRNWPKFLSEENQEAILASIEESGSNTDQTAEDLKKLNKEIRSRKGFPDYKWLCDNWENMDDLWHLINEFPHDTQTAWHKDHSRLRKNPANCGKIIICEDMEIEPSKQYDPYNTTTALNTWINRHPEVMNDCAINMWGITSEMKIGFYYLAWRGLLRAQFIECRNESQKSARITRFRPVRGVSISKNLLKDLETQIAPDTELSPSQRDASKELKYLLGFNDNFPVLLLGERGTGKSDLVKSMEKEDMVKKEVLHVNCAVFQDPQMAQSEFFGYVEGAYTGAGKGKEGVFRLAEDNILFLDEIHNLDKKTQSLLLISLQTDSEGNYKFKKLGAANKWEITKFQLICASNRSEEKLRTDLMPDFFDRVSQRIVSIKPLETGQSVLKEFSKVWKNMKFKNGETEMAEPCDEEFRDWLSKIKTFPGNYRDLQKIAILAADYERLKDKLDIKAETLVEYVSRHWQPAKPIDETSENGTVCFKDLMDRDHNFSADKIVKQLKHELATAAEALGGGQKEASRLLGVTAKTLIEWKKFRIL